MNPLDIVLDRLSPYGLKSSGRDRWRACCPAHGGRNRSTLSVGVGADGAVLMRCWHGCEVEQIAHAIGLELHELFPPRDDDKHATAKPRRVGLMTSGQAINLIRSEVGVIWATLAALQSGNDINENDLARAVAAADRVESICQGFTE